MAEGRLQGSPAFPCQGAHRGEIRLEQHLRAVFVIFDSAGFLGVLRFNIGLEIVLKKTAQRWRRLPFSNSNEALGKPGAVGGFNLASDLIVALFCGFANQFSVPHEFVPVDVAAFIE
jgi:hypothetical protein